jgi:hypothetical protein
MPELMFAGDGVGEGSCFLVEGTGQDDATSRVSFSDRSILPFCIKVGPFSAEDLLEVE